MDSYEWSISLLWFRVKPFLVFLFSMEIWGIWLMLLFMSWADVNGMLALLRELWRMKTAPQNALSRSDLEKRNPMWMRMYMVLKLSRQWSSSAEVTGGCGQQSWKVVESWYGVSGVVPHESNSNDSERYICISWSPSAADMFSWNPNGCMRK